MASALLLCGLLFLGGCGSTARDVSQADAQTGVRLEVLARMYKEYMAGHRDRPPKDEKTLRKFLEGREYVIEEYKQEQLISSMDDLFVSARDNQPFIVFYGNPVEVSYLPGAAWVAHEQTGEDGLRMAARLRAGVQILDPEEFAQEF